MLTDIIPGKWRKVVYAIFAAVGTVLGAIQVVYFATATPQPVWLTSALAVLAFIATAVGSVAKANVDPPAVPQHALPVEPYALANADGTVTSVAVDGTITKV
jgi:hypothetical protein